MKKRTIECDVCVVGGGTAGLMAALSASDSGAKTVLVEKNGILGGTMTACGVNYPGLFFAWGKQIIGGKCFDMIKRVEALGGCRIPEVEYAPEKHFTQQVRMNSFILGCVMDELCREYGVEVLFHSMLYDARENDVGVELDVACKEGPLTVSAKKAIDCTADADLAGILAYPRVKSASLQPATLFVKGRALDPLPDIDRLCLEAQRATDEGKLPPWIANRSYSKLVRGLSMTYHVECSEDADTSEGKTRLEMRARRDALAAVSFIKAFPGCEGFEIEQFSFECGVRETNRIVGEYTVSAEDYISGRSYPDAICNAFYPIDLHVPPYGIKQVFFKEGVYARIPYSALVPKGSRHLICAGRMISSDTDANSALRVQAPCMAMGQAAGVAAALCAASGRKMTDPDLDKVKQELKRQGAVLCDEV
ncbi:MAG: FAD-dependent oxidoreductase [Ruminococcaceae bacterium]|nr:FAD-dependent oxidoreductase [Oscillospiraceae bacterium]